jgi:hypothetical protein
MADETTPDEIIRELKRVIECQYAVNVDLKEQVQAAEADAAHWKSECKTWEAEAKSQTHYRHMCLHIPWTIFDQIIRSLEAGDAGHALKLLNREAQS